MLMEDNFSFVNLGVSVCLLNAYITTGFSNNCVTALTDNEKLIMDNLSRFLKYNVSKYILALSISYFDLQRNSNNLLVKS